MSCYVLKPNILIFSKLRARLLSSSWFTSHTCTRIIQSVSSTLSCQSLESLLRRASHLMFIVFLKSWIRFWELLSWLWWARSLDASRSWLVLFNRNWLHKIALGFSNLFIDEDTHLLVELVFFKFLLDFQVDESLLLEEPVNLFRFFEVANRSLTYQLRLFHDQIAVLLGNISQSTSPRIKVIR